MVYRRTRGERMDLSKLPRMSNTPNTTSAPQAPAPTATGQAPPARQPLTGVDPVQGPAGLGADIWFMSIIGIVLILFGRSFIAYEWAHLRHQPYHTNVTWDSGEKS